MTLSLNTVMAGSSSSAAAASTASGDSSGPSWGQVVGVLVSSAVIAAVVSAAVTVYLAWRKSREEERARVRTVLAEAFEVVTAYKEVPYAIRRRRKSKAEDERVRLSEELRQVQARLTYYSAWIRAESTTLGEAYDELVTELRKVAGQACHDAWRAEPITDDKDMNIGREVIDLTSLTDLESAFATASTTYLKTFLKLRRF